LLSTGVTTKMDASCRMDVFLAGAD
jgi:hypothetical protein